MPYLYASRHAKTRIAPSSRRIAARRYGPKASGVSKKTRKAVKKVIMSLAEKKEITYTNGSGGVNYIVNAVNAATFNANNVFEITPNSTTLICAQGTNQGTRIGNRVRITKAELKVAFFPAPYDATLNAVPIPQVLNMWFVKVKSLSQLKADVSTVIQSVFFQNGSTAVGMTGDIRDYLYDVNKDVFTLYGKKTYKLGAAVYAGSGGAQVNQYNFANNDFKINHIHTIDLMKHGYPTVCEFNDNSNVAMFNPLFMVFSPNDADGGANASTTSAAPVTFNYTLNVEYVDF